MVHRSAVRHPVSARHRFYELVCLQGWGLAPAAFEVGAGMGTSTRWWRKAVGMQIQIAKGPHGGPAIGTATHSPNRRALTLDERRVIEYGLEHGHAPAHIAAKLKRHRSVVTREVAKNCCEDGLYDASVAHFKATAARLRPKGFKLDVPRLAEQVSDRLEQGWSPELISTVLKTEHPHDDDWHVSHETIYQSIYVQGRGQLRADLHKHLSTRRPRRRPQPRSAKKGPSPYKEAFTISQRPKEAADRAVPGHWEGDLIVGPYSRSAIGTLVERTTRFTILLHLPGRHTATEVANAMIREMRDLPEHLRQSLTWDRGSELAEYARIQTALDMKVYFCDPHSPWQRGSNENTNRLLRHWFPKSTDLSTYTIEDLRAAQNSLNSRPRPTLELETPATRLNRLLTPAA